MTDLYNQMINRSSCREFIEYEINKEDKYKMLNVARRCPTSINGQQFSAIIVKDKEKRNKIGDLLERQPWIKEASLFVVYCMDFYRASKALEMIDKKIVNTDSIDSIMVGSIDCAIALTHTMIMAENLGYSTVPIGAIRRYAKEISEILNLPKYVFPVLGLCIGKAKNKQEITPRFDYDTLIKVDEYSQENIEELIKNYDKVVYEDIIKREKGKETNNEKRLINNYTEKVDIFYSKINNENEKEILEKQGFRNIK